MEKEKFSAELPQIAQYDHRQNTEERLVFPSLQALMAFLDQFDTSDCYFRGQAGLWDVVSSVYRHSGTARFEKAQIMTVAAVSLLKDNEYIRNVVKDNDNHALAIAQHYGCPTDLVDVTTSLQVAGYFASSENSLHQNQPEGCIWVFPESEIQIMQDLIRFIPLEDGVAYPEYVTDMLEKNNGGLLFKLDIPELSRLNAQKGAFLWDMCGTLKDLIRISGMGIRFVFRHTPGEKRLFDKEEGELFPHPNQLESEIMRIFTEKRRVDGLPEYIGPIMRLLNENTGVSEDSLPRELVAHSKDRMVLPMPDYFSPSFGEYCWQRRTVTHSDLKPKNINMDKCVYCFTHFEPDGVLTIVESILTNLKNETLTDYLICLIDRTNQAIFAIEDTRDTVNVVLTLNNYSYTPEEIAEILVEYFRICIFKQQNQFAPHTDEEFEVALIFGQIDALAKKYYGGTATKLNMYDAGGYVSFWLPADYTFLDEACAEEFKNFDKSAFTFPDILEAELAEIPENARIFLYQSQPRKIISYENMKRMFIRLIIPQLLTLRPAFERLYIPDHVTKISLPYFGRPLHIM